ncbi:hypothetical protein, partial [Thermus scotoductus]
MLSPSVVSSRFRGRFLRSSSGEDASRNRTSRGCRSGLEGRSKLSASGFLGAGRDGGGGTLGLGRALG